MKLFTLILQYYEHNCEHQIKSTKYLFHNSAISLLFTLILMGKVKQITKECVHYLRGKFKGPMRSLRFKGDI